MVFRLLFVIEQTDAKKCEMNKKKGFVIRKCDSIELCVKRAKHGNKRETSFWVNWNSFFFYKVFGKTCKKENKTQVWSRHDNNNNKSKKKYRILSYASLDHHPENDRKSEVKQLSAFFYSLLSFDPYVHNMP